MVKEKIIQMIAMKKSNSEICDVIAKDLMKRYNFLSVDSTPKQSEMFVYNKGIYTETARMIIKQECEGILDSFIKTNMVNEIINKIERQTLVDRSVLVEGDVDLLCVENGVLNLKTGELSEHSPAVIFLSKFPVEYNKDASCNKFMEFLTQTLTETDIVTMQEWIGFILRRRYHEKKAAVCIGPTNTGKTILLNVVRTLVGLNNASSIDLHDIVKDTHALDGLYNKYVNINDELTSADLSDVSRFKKLTGRSTLNVNPKFKSQFSFENYAKLMFATNKMPCLKETIEDPESYYNRWIVFNFDNIIEELYQDKLLIEKLTEPSELSGILLWALQGLQRLMKNKRFSYSVTWQEVERMMKTSGESVYSFEVECCNKSEGNLVGKDVMYERYKEYCSLNNKTAEASKEAFGKKFKPNYVVNKHNGPDAYKGWLNVKVVEVLPVMGV